MRMLFRAQAGCSYELVRSPSYHWDSSVRAGGGYVVFQYTLSGRGVFQLNRRRFSVEQGQAFFTLVPENARYFYAQDETEPWTFSYINFVGESSEHLWRWFREKHGCIAKMPLDSVSSGLFSELIRQTQAIGHSSPEMLSSLIYQFVMSLSAQQTENAPASISSIIQLMERRPEHPYAVKELAAFCGLSREHFTRKFIEETGESPARYRRRLLMQQAQHWLARTNLPVEEIARRIGLCNGRALSKLFKQQIGCAPLQYRKRSQAPQIH
ncbi:MAG: AraC family transcriptional regulator [Verrucomicrobiota bacterium]